MTGHDFNLVEVAIGRRGTGKSTWARERAGELRKHAYVLVHDPSGGFPVREGDAIYHSLSDLVIGVERNGGACIHVLTDRHAIPSEFLRTAWRLSERSLAVHQKDPTPRGPIPVVAIFDEAALLHLTEDPKEARAFKSVLLETITTGRHIGAGVGLIMTTQHANLLSYHAIEQVTMLVLFKITGGLCFQKLRMADVPEDVLGEVKELSGHDFITWEP
jgi:hypothetical protein